MSRHVGILLPWRAIPELRRGRMALQPLISTFVEAHRVGTKLVAVHWHDTPVQLEISPRFLLDELHREPKGARMHPDLPRDFAQSSLDVAHFARPQWHRRSSVDVPSRLATSSAKRAAILGPFHRVENSRYPNAISGSGDQTTEGRATSSPPTVTDRCHRNERAAQPSWA